MLFDLLCDFGSVSFGMTEEQIHRLGTDGRAFLGFHRQRIEQPAKLMNQLAHQEILSPLQDRFSSDCLIRRGVGCRRILGAVNFDVDIGRLDDGTFGCRLRRWGDACGLAGPSS